LFWEKEGRVRLGQQRPFKSASFHRSGAVLELNCVKAFEGVPVLFPAEDNMDNLVTYEYNAMHWFYSDNRRI